MVQYLGKKWPLCAITAYLVLATIGTFTLTAFDNPLLDSLAGKNQDRRIFLTSFDRFINTPAVVKTKDNNFSPLRHCLLRIVMPLNLISAGSGLLCSAVRPVVKTAAQANKNIIILKLRI
jgi:hypothetical protein